MFSFSDPEVCLFQTISEDNFIKHSFEFHDKIVKKVRFSDKNMSKEINKINESISEILHFSENKLQSTPKSFKESDTRRYQNLSMNLPESLKMIVYQHLIVQI